MTDDIKQDEAKNRTALASPAERCVIRLLQENTMTEIKDGEWKLISPNGTEFKAETPLRCVQEEISSRVSAEEMLKRILDDIENNPVEQSHDDVLEFISELKKKSQAVYLACEPEVARDICLAIRDSINIINDLSEDNQNLRKSLAL